MKKQSWLFVAGAVLLAVTVGAVIGEVPALRSTDEPTAVTTATTARQRVNVNTADTGQLSDIPGIGAALAKRIVEGRTQLGGYRDLWQLATVDGITAEMVEKWQDYLTVSDE